MFVPLTKKELSKIDNVVKISGPLNDLTDVKSLGFFEKRKIDQIYLNITKKRSEVGRSHSNHVNINQPLKNQVFQTMNLINVNNCLVKNINGYKNYMLGFKFNEKFFLLYLSTRGMTEYVSNNVTLEEIELFLNHLEKCFK